MRRELQGKDLKVALLDESDFKGIRTLSYSFNQPVEGVKVIGEQKDYSFIEQEVSFEGSLTVTQSAYNRLKYKLPPGVFIVDIPLFTITALQVNPNTLLGQKMIFTCKFTGAGQEIQADAGLVEVELPLYIADLIDNAPL